jgi:hypothetical protein
MKQYQFLYPGECAIKEHASCILDVESDAAAIEQACQYLGENTTGINRILLVQIDFGVDRIVADIFRGQAKVVRYPLASSNG